MRLLPRELAQIPSAPLFGSHVPAFAFVPLVSPIRLVWLGLPVLVTGTDWTGVHLDRVNPCSFHAEMQFCYQLQSRQSFSPAAPPPPSLVTAKKPWRPPLGHVPQLSSLTSLTLTPNVDTPLSLTNLGRLLCDHPPPLPPTAISCCAARKLFPPPPRDKVQREFLCAYLAAVSRVPGVDIIPVSAARELFTLQFCSNCESHLRAL